MKAYPLTNSMVTVKTTYIKPLAGYGKWSALCGDVKNSEEVVRNLRCLSGASSVDFRLQALSSLQEAHKALTFCNFCVKPKVRERASCQYIIVRRASSLLFTAMM